MTQTTLTERSVELVRIWVEPNRQEQAISITNHRFGNHDAEFESVLPRPGASPQVRGRRP